MIDYLEEWAQFGHIRGERVLRANIVPSLPVDRIDDLVHRAAENRDRMVVISYPDRRDKVVEIGDSVHRALRGVGVRRIAAYVPPGTYLASSRLAGNSVLVVDRPIERFSCDSEIGSLAVLGWHGGPYMSSLDRIQTSHGRFLHNLGEDLGEAKIWCAVHPGWRICDNADLRDLTAPEYAEMVR